MAGSGPKLKALPLATVRLITSSQVITSTHSVVKELVENALDAAATCIDVKLENYGFEKIEVRDNGCGIARSDTACMGQPHYTSKITCHADLGQLQTYGFRGEALGSLCSVSDVSITTRTCLDDVSTVYELDCHGDIVNTKPSHLGEGTTVVAVNLFKNLPVRRQFYNTSRKQKEELKCVEDLVIAYGIICPHVRFELRHNKCVIWQKGSVVDHREALLSVWGAGVLGHMTYTKRQQLEALTTKTHIAYFKKIPLGEEFTAFKSWHWISLEIMDIECFLPKQSMPPGGQLAHRSNSRCFLFVNKRPVIMKDVEKLLRRYHSNATGCENTLVPMSFVSVTVVASSVDVNVDPNKTRVMLHEKSSFLKFIADVFAEVYGPLKTGGENDHGRESLDTGHCESTEDTSQGAHDIRGLRQDSPCGQKLTRDKTNSETQNREFGRDIQKWFGEEISDNLETLGFSGETSMTVHKKTAHIERLDPDAGILHPSHLPQNAQDSSFPEGSNEQLPASVGGSLNATLDVDFNLLDDDLDIAVIAHMATEAGWSTLLPSGEVKTPSDIYKGCDQSGTAGGCMTGALSPGDVGGDGTVLENGGSENYGEKWSRGEAVTEKDGQFVQPVSLLVSSCLQDDRQYEEKKTLPTTHIRQTTLHDVAEGHRVKRPNTSYIFFSQEVRSQVTAENTGANFQQISRLVAEKWNSLGAEEKKKYETMATTDRQRYKDEVSTQDPYRRNASTSALAGRKKRKLDQDSSQRTLPAIFSQLSPISCQVKQKLAKFSMEALRQTYSKPFQSSQIWRQSTDKLQFIGQLQSHGVWLGIHGNSIMLFHPTRAKEELICHRLMQHHVIPVNQLKEPIILCAEDVGGQECWAMLQSLEKSAVGINGSYTHYTDTRLVNNGLKLQESYLDGSTSRPKIAIVAMTTCMNYFGTSDLREILQVITHNPSVTVSKSRPSKVRHYIQGEAVRMSRQLPMALGKEEVEDLMEETIQQLPPGTVACFHHRPFLSCLLHLDHVVQSEDLEVMETSFELTP